MLHAALALLVLAFPVVVVEEDGWAERLVGPDAESARAELVAMKRKASPILAAILRDGDQEQAWAALGAFVELKEDGRGAAKELIATVEREDADAWRRALAALALGAAGDKSKSAVKPMFRLLESVPAAELSVPIRVALAAIGKDAAKPAAKLMLGGESIRVRQWGAQILYAMGEASSSAKRELVEVIEDNHGYYVYAIAGEALKRSGKAGAKAYEKVWSERLEMLPRQVGGGFPLPLKACEDNAFLFEVLRIEGNAPELPPLDEMALPASFGDFNGDGQTSAGEVVLEWGGFLATKLDELRSTLYSGGAVATFADWMRLAEPVHKSCVGLQSILGKT